MDREAQVRQESQRREQVRDSSGDRWVPFVFLLPGLLDAGGAWTALWIIRGGSSV